MKLLAALLPVVIIGGALFFLGDFVRDYDFADILVQINAIPGKNVLMAAGLTLISYLIMSTYDVMGFTYIRHPLKRWKIVSTSMIGYALNNSTGFGGVVGNAFRFRNYMNYGVKPIDVLKVVSLVVLGFWMGTSAVTGLAMLIYPLEFSGVPTIYFRILGGSFVALVLIYVGLTLVRREPLRFSFRSKIRTLQIPSFKLTLFTILLASADWILGASVLYILLPAPAQIFFPIFVAIFSTSIILGLITNMPGGLGVLETMILIFVGSSGATPNQIVGSLVAYRFIFNFCPFVLALIAVGFIEVRRFVLTRNF